MTFGQFKRLIDGGEKAHVDFKLTCNAFDRSCGDAEKAKAELVKDICAMANNGNIASYLIIGVSDDRKNVRSVSNPHFTSQNIQTLIRDSIHPRPTIRVHHLLWSDAPEQYAGVKFIVIQVGPNPKTAYRFAKDHIDWNHKYYFRKHEVWVRNEDTSDLATPEQIGRLLRVPRLGDAKYEPDFESVEYQKLALAKQLPQLAEDARKVFEEIGAHTSSVAESESNLPWEKCSFRVRLKLRGKLFVFRCEFRSKLASKDEKYITMQNCWSYEHGMIVFVIGSFTEAGKFFQLQVDAKASWGSLNVLSVKKNSYFRRQVPSTFKDVPISILTLPRLATTARLRASLGELFRDLEADDVLFKHLDEARTSMNAELSRWSRKTFNGVKDGFVGFYAPDDKAAEFQNEIKSVSSLLKQKA